MEPKKENEKLVSLKEFFESPKLSEIVRLENNKTPVIANYHKQEKECIRRFIGDKIAVVLDIGCGNGNSIGFIKIYGFRRVYIYCL